MFPRPLQGVLVSNMFPSLSNAHLVFLFQIGQNHMQNCQDRLPGPYPTWLFKSGFFFQELEGEWNLNHGPDPAGSKLGEPQDIMTWVGSQDLCLGTYSGRQCLNVSLQQKF
jgi:hypothetical protein